MNIIITSNQEQIIMDLPYDEILKLLEILKQDKSNYSKSVTITKYNINEEDCEFIKHLKNLYDTRISCEIYKP